MAISAGSYAAAIVVSSLIGLLMVGVGGVLLRRMYRRKKERRHAQIPARDYYLDFGSDDWEVGSTVPVYARSTNESTEALSTTGIRPMSRLLGSEVSLVGVPSLKSSSQDGFPNPYEAPRPASPAKPVPILKKPIPPTKSMTPSSFMTSEHQLHSLVSRPRFLTEPRPAPSPGASRTKNRGSPDVRSSNLTRLPSTRSKRTARSADTADEPESPVSVYSQVSAAPSAQQRSVRQYSGAGDMTSTPPLPPLPEKYQCATTSERRAGSGSTSSPNWREHTLLEKALPPLEDSFAFPLPAPTPLHANPRTSHSQWLSRSLWMSANIASSPYQIGYEPEDTVVQNPAYEEETSDVFTDQSYEVPRQISQDDSDVFATPRKSHRGSVEYRLPSIYGTERSFTAISPRDTYFNERNFPRT